MASIIPVGDSWRAQVRRKGNPVQTKTFTKKILAELWARGIEADIDSGRTGVSSASGAARHLTIGKLIERYTEEIGKQKPFGRNKDDVCALKMCRVRLAIGRWRRPDAMRLA